MRLHAGIRMLDAFQACRPLLTQNLGVDVLKTSHQAEEASWQWLRWRETDVEVLHGRPRHAIELHQILHLIIEHWWMRGHLELPPKHPLDGVALLGTEVTTGVGRTPRQVREGLCGLPQLSQLDGPVAAKNTLKQVQPTSSDLLTC